MQKFRSQSDITQHLLHDRPPNGLQIQIHPLQSHEKNLTGEGIHTYRIRILRVTYNGAPVFT